MTSLSGTSGPANVLADEGQSTIDSVSQLVPPEYKSWREWYADLKSRLSHSEGGSGSAKKT